MRRVTTPIGREEFSPEILLSGRFSRRPGPMLKLGLFGEKSSPGRVIPLAGTLSPA